MVIFTKIKKKVWIITTILLILLSVANVIILCYHKATASEFIQKELTQKVEFNYLTNVACLMSLITACLIILLSFFLYKNYFKPLFKLKLALKDILDGDDYAELPDINSNSELTELTYEIKGLLEKIQSAKQHTKVPTENNKESSDEKRKNALNIIAENFDRNIRGVVEFLTSASQKMERTAQAIVSSVNLNVTKMKQLADYSNQTSNTVDNVAAATEELSASVGEIGRQMARSTDITKEAVSKAQGANMTVQKLSDAAHKIGDVVNLINDIAGQINLLALNATIEAARAGEAGKGFAVVANEVKNLASQTGKATEDISNQISSIQQQTTGAVEFIQGITTIISEINQIAVSISATVSEQSNATVEIARNMQQAAKNTNDVSKNADSVLRHTSENINSVNDMLQSCSELAQQSTILNNELNQLLKDFKSANI